MTNPSDAVFDFSPHLSTSPIAPPRTRDNSTQTSSLSVQAPSFFPARLPPAPAALSAEAEPFMPLTAQLVDSEEALRIRCNQEQLKTLILQELNGFLYGSFGELSKKVLIQCYQKVASFLQVKSTGDYNLIKELIAKGIIYALREQCLIQVSNATAEDA